MGMASSDTSSERSPVPVEGSAPAVRRGFDSEPRSLTVEERAAFIEYVTENPDCKVGEALEHVGSPDLWRRDIKALRRTDPEFADDYNTARGRGEEQILRQAVKLAIEGVQKPIVSMGKIVAYETVYSERMLQTLFNSMTPEGRAAAGTKFGIEINTAGGDVKLQEGVSLDEVAAFMREHVPGFQAQLEGESAGEIVDVTDEPAE